LIPEFRLERPEKNLKTGPDLSSSHCKQSFNDPSGLTLGFLVIQAHMQTLKQFFLVLIVLYSQISAHWGVNPISIKHFKADDSVKAPIIPHLYSEKKILLS
jgi:hypothetical protein